MSQIYFVVDGPRDIATIPTLVSKILNVRIQVKSTTWKELRVNAGYTRKLKFAIRQALDAGVAALVAVADRDKVAKREKLGELVAAREQSPEFPIALGEADPHGEAWLLDDPVAIRRGLGLSNEIDIPNIRHVENPKNKIEELRQNSELSSEPILHVLEAITQHVDPSRFRHSKETGFESFEKDVRHQLKTAAAGCGNECQCGDACA